MSEPRARPDPDRRRLLSAAGIAAATALAGCSNPMSQSEDESDDEPHEETDDGEGAADEDGDEPDSDDTDDTGDTDGTNGADDADGADDTDGDDAAEAPSATYEEVYEGIVDSVTFLQVLGVENPQTGAPGRGQGSGFLYDDRYIVTNEHVVANADDVDVRYTNGDWSTTEILGADRYSDLAVLEVDHVPESADSLTLSSSPPRVGQEVLAIGNPFGLEGSMSQGIVSGVDRTLEMPGQGFVYPNVVQTDAGINPGNSGGPLVDLDGEVVGVINAAGGDNVGFAISAALTERVVPGLIDDGEYHHAVLGINHVAVDPAIAEENDLPEADGVMVAAVVEGGPADGVLEGRTDEVQRNGRAIPIGGDVVLGLAGEAVPDHHALARVLALETSPGETVEMEIHRDGARETIEVTLGSREEFEDELDEGPDPGPGPGAEPP